jgi:hypothetical protein
VRRPRPLALLLLVPLLLVPMAACTRGDGAAPGAPPGPAHQDAIRERHDAVLAARYPLAAPSAFTFAAPVPGRVAKWHWEPQQDGRAHAAGHHRGWTVAFEVTPHYAGYPPQPRAQRLAFFAGGVLRGLFAPGEGSAPLALDAWSPLWIDPAWPPPAAPR